MTPFSLLAPARRVSNAVLRAQSDDRLAALARAGSEPAFEAIVARYHAELVRHCSRVVASGRAEDVVQEALVKAYAAFGRGEEVRSLRPWLHRIAHNMALNLLRDQPNRDEPLREHSRTAGMTVPGSGDRGPASAARPAEAVAAPAAASSAPVSTRVARATTASTRPRVSASPVRRARRAPVGRGEPRPHRRAEARSAPRHREHRARQEPGHTEHRGATPPPGPRPGLQRLGPP